MTKFIIKGKVKYQGKLYNSGEVVEVAKEHVEEFKKHGWEIVKGEAPQAPEGQNGNGEGQVDYSKLKKDEIIAELQKRGVEFNKDAKKDELLALLV